MVSCALTAGSFNANHGRCRRTGVSHEDAAQPDLVRDHGGAQRLGHRRELEHRVGIHRGLRSGDGGFRIPWRRSSGPRGRSRRPCQAGPSSASMHQPVRTIWSMAARSFASGHAVAVAGPPTSPRPLAQPTSPNAAQAPRKRRRCRSGNSCRPSGSRVTAGSPGSRVVKNSGTPAPAGATSLPADGAWAMPVGQANQGFDRQRIALHAKPHDDPARRGRNVRVVAETPRARGRSRLCSSISVTLAPLIASCNAIEVCV